MNKKSFTTVTFFVFVFSLLCAATSDAARKPEIVSHDAKLLQKAISINIKWQSQYPVVLATVSAGKESKEIKLDEYDDNIKDARGFHGEASLVIEIDEIGYLDDEVRYVIQLEDDLGRKSRLVTGQIKLDKAFGVEEGEWEEDRKLARDFVDSKPKKKVGMIDQVLDVMKRHDTPPVIQDVKINRLGQKKVSFSAKAIDDKGLNKISFKIFNSAGKLVNQQELTELGKLWQGDSETFTLDFGSYKVVAQAIDSANNFSPKKQKDFSLEEPKPKDRKPPWTAASPGGGTYKAAQSVTLECTDDKGGSGCDKTMYSIDESAFKVYTTPLSLPLKDITESKLKFYSVDKAGNREATKTAHYAIKEVTPPPPPSPPPPEDTVSPETSATPKGGTYEAARSVTLECTDDKGGSGCAKTMYSIDESAFKAYTAPLSLPLKDKKKSTLKFYSMDKAGNREATKTTRYAIKAVTPPPPPPPPPPGTSLPGASLIEVIDTGSGNGESHHYGMSYGNNNFYLTLYRDDKVTKISLKDKSVAAGYPMRIQVGGPHGLVTDETDGSVWVCNLGGRKIEKFDSSKSNIGSISVGKQPVNAIIHNGKLYVADRKQDKIYIINKSTHKIEKSFAIKGMMPDSAGGYVDMFVYNKNLFIVSDELKGIVRSGLDGANQKEIMVQNEDHLGAFGVFVQDDRIYINAHERVIVTDLSGKVLNKWDIDKPDRYSDFYIDIEIVGTNIYVASGWDVLGPPNCNDGKRPCSTKGSHILVYKESYTDDYPPLKPVDRPSPPPTDKISPKTNATPKGGTYKAAQSVTLECTDDKGGSGCDKTMYSIDESAFKAYTAPLSLPLKDITESKLKFYSVDKTGNKEQVKTASYAIKLSHKIYDDATAAAFLKDLSNSALVTIDFENISTKSEPRTFRGDEYAKKWISFSKPAKEAMKIEPPYNNYSNSNFLSIGNRPYDSPNGDSLNDSLVVKIEGGAKAIGWTFFDVAGGQKDESITFYDRNNNIIYKQNSIPSPKSGLTSFFGIISETPVYKIEIIEASNDGDDVGYDNFIYEPVNKIADKYKDK